MLLLAFAAARKEKNKAAVARTNPALRIVGNVGAIATQQGRIEEENRKKREASWTSESPSAPPIRGLANEQQALVRSTSCLIDWPVE